ncbi:FmdB family transcriptional regulator [Nocardia terpenica]|uniref:FmdB family zinc ribbon protein n=1 Tax=Nocardia terpenica TaxID=455432 RepID=UPI0009ED1F8E|nr:FmdB family zinc ribbon protein [Nocardia terpenica]MBF6060360.1 FmdB family transcriptional regulator [Nocardia terpenica]MBF6103620.1 FmdB family transcriptional regulator [Nocardia terpenica]MBF6112006.1 FmdB family transcriptional regulator [Nocardia terpenica]MBF6117841.1 FmdB family transcriptional regulator [Nocardia terpenica]MBF6153415.1 FmdB family transcriptional regulator [Nocardia terpenica]
MPTYSYQCTQCGDKFDIVQSFSDDALTTCEKCDGKLRKLFNSVGIVFKGSGFYRTDSRNGSSTASEPAKPSSSSNGSSGSESSSGSSGSASASTAASSSTASAGSAA